MKTICTLLILCKLLLLICLVHCLKKGFLETPETTSLCPCCVYTVFPQTVVSFRLVTTQWTLFPIATPGRGMTTQNLCVCVCMYILPFYSRYPRGKNIMIQGPPSTGKSSFIKYPRAVAILDGGTKRLPHDTVIQPTACRWGPTCLGRGGAEEPCH